MGVLNGLLLVVEDLVFELVVFKSLVLVSRLCLFVFIFLFGFLNLGFLIVVLDLVFF